MSDIFGYVALAALLGFFVEIARASLGHFAQDQTLGHRLIQVASPLCTICLTALVVLGGPVDLWPGLLALALTATGYALFRQALAESDPGFLSVAFGRHASEHLMVEGIYGLIRNPLYTSYLLYWGAWPVLLGLAWPALAVAIFFTVVYWQAARREEAALAEQFGPDYLTYQARTGRFLPKFASRSIFRPPKP